MAANDSNDDGESRTAAATKPRERKKVRLSKKIENKENGEREKRRDLTSTLTPATSTSFPGGQARRQMATPVAATLRRGGATEEDRDREREKETSKDKRWKRERNKKKKKRKEAKELPWQRRRLRRRQIEGGGRTRSTRCCMCHLSPSLTVAGRTADEVKTAVAAAASASGDDVSAAVKDERRERDQRARERPGRERPQRERARRHGRDSRRRRGHRRRQRQRRGCSTVEGAWTRLGFRTGEGDGRNVAELGVLGIYIPGSGRIRVGRGFRVWFKVLG